MDGRQFLGTARFLLASGRGEAAHRSAIGRAYYACFLAARAVAFASSDARIRLKAGITSERKIKHQSLLDYLKECKVESIQSLGDELGDLQGNREDADYDMTGAITSSDAEDAIELANSFLGRLDREPPGSIGRAMDSWIQLRYP